MLYSLYLPLYLTILLSKKATNLGNIEFVTGVEGQQQVDNTFVGNVLSDLHLRGYGGDRLPRSKSDHIKLLKDCLIMKANC